MQHVEQGVVMNMDTHEHEERAASLRDAIGRISEARALRTGTVPTILEPGDLPPLEKMTDEPRRGLFGFARRAREAAGTHEG